MPDVAVPGSAEITALAEGLLALQRELPRFVRRLYEPRLSLGLAQLRVLSELHRHGSLHVGELAEVLQVRLPTMTQSLDRLEEQGWVRRCAGTADRRNVAVALTEDGAAVYAAAHAEVIARLGERLAKLNDEDRAALAAALPVVERLKGE